MRSEYIVFGVLILLVYSLTGVFAANTITSEFSVEGCTDGDVDLAIGECSREGYDFCADGGVMQGTIQIADACDFGDVDVDGYPPNEGTPQCCPSGYLCDENGDMKCGQRDFTCSGYTDIGSCEATACFWIEDGGSGLCVNTPLDFSCSAYQTQIECTEDFSNLGRIGFGTEIAGDYFTDQANNGPGDGFVAPRGNFLCEWNLGECKLRYDITEDISLNPNPAPEFSCYKNFTAGFCDGGSQELRWTAEVFNGGGVPALVTNAQCEDGVDTRSCGAPVVRLPGFSLFALLASIAIIGLFYFFRRE